MFVPPELPTSDSAATLVISPSCFLPLHPSGLNWPRVRGYEILSVIGCGGMGIVYKARHRDLHRTVALKMLRGAALTDPEFHERFHVEAEAVARLQHPNIIQVFEIGTVEPLVGEVHPSPFIALEFVDGGSLSRHTDRPQTQKYAAEMVEKLARAVHSAHRLGVVHRDLKPANVLLTHAGEPKIADFGLAKQLGAERDAGGRFHTQAGTVVGTPEYMAPEQATGAPPTPAVDVYALGVILYELLTARVPFHAASPVETMNLLLRQEPVSPRQLQPGLPRDLETICLKCLEKEPGKRYASAQALADDLRRFLDGRAILARRVSGIEKAVRWCRRNPLAAASLAGVVGIFLAAFLLVSRSYIHAEAAFHNAEHQREEAVKKEKAERWERYRANIVATASAFQVYNVGSARLMLEDAPEEHRNWEWRHFQSRLDLAQNVLRADDAEVTSMSIAPNGDRAALFGTGGFARVWDTTDGKEVRTFRNIPEFQVATLATLSQRFTLSQGATLSPDGKTIAYRPNVQTIVLWDIETARVRATLRGHDQGIYTMQFTADASRVVSADNQTVRVWDAATGQALRVFRPYQSGLSAMDISPDGSRVITEDRIHNAVRLWRLDTGGEIATLAGHEHGLQGVCFNQRGTRVVTNHRFPKNEMKLWNATTGQLIGVLGRHSNKVTGTAFNSDGTRFASCSLDQTVRLWDGVTGQLIATLKGHNGRVNCVAFSPNGKQLVSGSEDHTVRLWDVADGAPLAVLNGHAASVDSVAYSTDGSRITSAAGDGTIRFWDARMGECNGILRGHTSFVYSVALHPDGERVASAGWDGTVRIWDATTGRQTSLLNHGENTIVSSVAIHPAGRLLATRTREFICLWDVESGQELQRWSAPFDIWRDSRLAFSPKGDLLASGCQGGEVRLWDVDTRKEAAVLRGHKDLVCDVTFSPDGKRLATAGGVFDKTIRIWDVAKKEQVQVLEGHKDCVYSLAFSRDGKLLASGSTDGTARLWDAETWREIAMLKHGSNVYGLAFTPDGTRLACACADNSIRLWDMAIYQEVAELRGHKAYVHSIAFSFDGSRLVSGSGDFTVRVWDTVRPQVRARER